MAKYFSWVICGRRKRWCENFKSFGHSFTKIAYFKLNWKSKEIKLGACKCNSQKQEEMLLFILLLTLKFLT